MLVQEKEVLRFSEDLILYIHVEVMLLWKIANISVVLAFAIYDSRVSQATDL